jgi:hypothetical protein
MRFYYYIYYRVYKIISQLGHYRIYLWTSYNVTLMEIYLLIGIYMNLVNYNRDWQISKFFGVTIGLSIFILNELIFLRKKRYLRILEMFKNESKTSRILGSILMLSIFLITNILFFIGITNK